MKLIKLLYNLSIEQDGEKKNPSESQFAFFILVKYLKNEK